MPVDWELQVENCRVGISGLSSRPLAEWPQAARDGVQQLRQQCERDADYCRHAPFGVLRDEDLVRFLLARNGDVDQAVVMLRQALVWRTRRMPYWFLLNPNSDATQGILHEARLGKIYSIGRDRFGRGICVMDNTAQNTIDGAAQMRYLAYCVEAARGNCAEGVDKICVVMNLEGFSVFNAVPAQVIRETIDILTVVYPETLGVAIVWQPPRYANGVFAVFKKFVDPRTMQKFQWVTGKTCPNSEVDKTMIEFVGHDWRELTGLCMPRKERAYSEYFKREIEGARGFNFSSYSEGLFSRDKSRAAALGAPPWNLRWKDAIDESSWDGGWAGYWRSNLKGNAQRSVSPSSEHEVESDPGSEHWVTPPESENEMVEINVEPPSPSKTAVGKTMSAQQFQRTRDASLDILPSVVAQFHRLYSRASPACRNRQIHALLMVICTLVAVSTFAALLHTMGLRLPNLLQTFIALDIPLISVGFYILRCVDPMPKLFVYATGHCPWLPWGFLLLHVFLSLEVTRAFFWPAANEVASNAFLWSSLGIFDSMVGVSFALCWIHHLARQTKAYKPYARLRKYSASPEPRHAEARELSGAALV